MKHTDIEFSESQTFETISSVSQTNDCDSMMYGFDFKQRLLTAILVIAPGPNYDLVPFTKYYITQHKNKAKIGVEKGDVNDKNNNKNKNNACNC